MIKKTLIIFIYFILLLLLMFNFINFLYSAIPKIIIFAVNLTLLFSLAFLFIRINFKNQNIINSDNNSKQLSESITDADKPFNEYFEHFRNIRDEFSKLSIFNRNLKEQNNNMNDMALGNNENIEENSLDDIKNVFDVDKIKKLMDSVLNSKAFFDIYHKIPYLKTLVNHSIKTTEDAAMDLIDKFEKVSEESQRAKMNAKKNFEILKEGIKGKSFEELVEQSKSALSKYDDLIEILISLNEKSRNKLKDTSSWINKINTILNSIEEISEKNKVIAINSSIEAARIGEQGQGFRILSGEIRKLNQKTGKLTKEINKIMQDFNEYNNQLAQSWTSDTDQIIKEIKDASKNSDEVISVLINSYKTTSNSFTVLSESTDKIEEHLTKVMVSLQFQDITRQQLESVMDFCNSIQDDIKAQGGLFECIGLDFNEKNIELIERVKKETINKIKHFDKDKITKEFEEVEI